MRARVCGRGVGVRAVLGLGLGAWGSEWCIESVEGIVVGSSYMFKQGWLACARLERLQEPLRRNDLEPERCCQVLE